LVVAMSETAGKQIRLDFSMDQKQLAQIEQKLGFRILMTDRHDWDTCSAHFFGKKPARKQDSPAPWIRC